MKTNKFEKRFYRNWINAKDLFRLNVVVKESDIDTLTDKPIDSNFVKSRLIIYRRQIENYITRDERFLTSLKPISVELNAAPLIKRMSEAAKKANTGPMSAVAGAIAEAIGKDLIRKGCKEVIVENGGDIFLKTKKIRKVSIYSGKSKAVNNLFIKIKPQDTPLGICTSSGTIGHSLSFGCAESVVILSKNTALSDAVATKIANLIQTKEDLAKAIKVAKSIPGVMAALAILKNNLSCWGKITFVQ